MCKKDNNDITTLAKGKNTVSKKLPDDDKIILAVKRILERHRKAFLELAKQ